MNSAIKEEQLSSDKEDHTPNGITLSLDDLTIASDEADSSTSVPSPRVCTGEYISHFGG